MIEESWKAVVGYEGRYEVSDFGRVRRLLAYRSNGARIRAGIVKASLRSKKQPGKAYFCVGLNNGSGQRTFSVHRIVLEAFRGLCPEGMEGCHNDGDRKNNRLGNLRWDTQSGNQRDRDRHGTRNAAFGEEHPNSKLTEAEVERIFKLRADGFNQYRIASELGASQGHISDILGGKRWQKFCPSDQTIIDAIILQFDVNEPIARGWLAQLRKAA